MIPQILCINQSDSSAGTGLQADLKTMQAFGCYAATIVTAVSVQNTQKVEQVYPVPTEIISKQIQAVMEDLDISVIKTGMLGSVATIDMIGDLLDEVQPKGVKVVVDPVMTSRSGAILHNKEEMDAIKRRLLVHADIYTPNLKEAEELTGLHLIGVEEMGHAAEMLRTLGARTAIVKGGSLLLDDVIDVLADDDGIETYSNERHDTKATHGAGTTLTAALAALYAKGMSPREAFPKARGYLCRAIDGAVPIGKGHGPVNHLGAADG